MTGKGDSEEEIRAVHYLKTDSWELERLYPPEAGSPPPEFGDRFAELLLSDVPTKEEFDVRLAAMGLKVGSRNAPWPGAPGELSAYLETFRTERIP